MNEAQATRQIYWNISHVWMMYVLLAPTIAIGAYGIYRHISRWRRGLPLKRSDHPAQRFSLLANQALAQRRTAQLLYPGIFHRLIFYGFIILTIATTVVALDADFHANIMHGWFYLYFQSFTVDVFGALTMVGIFMAVILRYFVRPKRLVYTGEAGLILLLIFIILATGFALEGWRIAATNDPWAAWSPFGDLVAKAFGSWMSIPAMKAAHRITWWLHLVLCLAFLAWVPYSKMVHLITAPLNIYTANLQPIGAALKPVAFESSEAFGVNSMKRFTWKDLLDLDACTECGRCTEACPANTVGKELSPRDIIVQLRDLMHTRPDVVFGRNGATGEKSTSGPDSLPIIGAVSATAPAALWQCTTCAACVEACPVLIEQMPKIVDMRRYLVMEEANVPDTIQQALSSLERRGHPIYGTQASRLDWTEGLGINLIGDAKDAEVLLWVGCTGALVERNQKVTRATAQLLQRAGVKFAILGQEERCTGDPARRIGNEFLFEMLAKENIATLNKYQVKNIVTACPHCFNTFRHEYPRYGVRFEVYHHSEYLAKLVQEGRLKPQSDADKTITFHDPCYLGRQNGVYDAPRELVQISSGQPPLEMGRSRNKSFCCGGGGGGSYVEEPSNQRVNQERAREVLATGADVLTVACPFCMTMMEDGVNALKGQRDVQVLDVAELLLQSTHT